MEGEDNCEARLSEALSVISSGDSYQLNWAEFCSKNDYFQRLLGFPILGSKYKYFRLDFK